MSHYLDIHLRPDGELATHHILGALYTRLHRSLVKMGSTDIGVSFPGHDDKKPSLGRHLRLHGPEAYLEKLMQTAWLIGIMDHLQVGAIAPAPSDTHHRQVVRVQTKSSPARLRRRAMRRHGITAEQAELRIPDTAAERLGLPFVVLGSVSTGQPSFPLFIRHGPLMAAKLPGSFNAYGLSKGATIPWF